ncbi:hypothetical protein AB0F88_13405 [Streptosporangium sp. NPDC023963]|uniref:hypothetical protein n=1 Tax=Streptosporangium sp. NPDC023963 TaxID=3155608 RepID=UPI0034210683
MEPERSTRSPWLTGLISAGLASATGVAVNIATEHVESLTAWSIVAGLTLTTGLSAGFFQKARSENHPQLEARTDKDQNPAVSTSVFEATFTVQKDNVLRSAQVKISDTKIASQWIKSFDWQQIEGKEARDDE